MSQHCRHCAAPLEVSFCDLGVLPLSNAFLTPERLAGMEPFYPLHAMVCGKCFLVQVGVYQEPQDIFGDYAYFSSYSDTWLRHVEAYSGAIIDRLALESSHLVVELASNDGYLLKYFRSRGIPVLGVEPAANVASVAREAGIETVVGFFGAELASRLRQQRRGADLLIGNNVLAHVPELNDFVRGMKILLNEGGVITMEFPHLLKLIRQAQFDTIYHEHFSYFSFATACRVFAHHGLGIFDVDELPTHGGSLRIYVRHAGASGDVAPAVARLLDEERSAGLGDLDVYRAFQEQADAVKRNLLEFLIHTRRGGKRVAAYGAAAKGNTLLNYCGVRRDMVEFVVDRNPYKQGRYLPGSRIPVRAPEHVACEKPDYLLILPWNIRDEVIAQMAGIREWGGRFVVPVPRLEVIA